MIEPFKVKVVEPLFLTTEQERLSYLDKCHYNLFMLKSRMVTFDFLTDSGTSAMSQEQWSRLMLGDESYAGAKSFERFESVVQNLTGFPLVIPTHQGRSAEFLLMQALKKQGAFHGRKEVVGNTHFDTTRANIESVGWEAVDCLQDDVSSEDVFLGNMDLVSLEQKLKEKTVAFVIMTITNNSSGGTPVSLKNIKATKKLCEKYKVLMFIDGCKVFRKQLLY